MKAVKTKINNKWDLYLPEHRAEKSDWLTWEFERLESMSKNLNENDTIMYIGAEEGDMCALCALWGAKVIMIEPNDKVWPNIKLVWETNHLPDPECFVGFASDKTNIWNITIKSGFPECADGEIITDHGFKTLKEYPEIPQIKIDDIDRDITAISIDVEGSEWRVINGAVETMKNKKPKIWLSGHPEFMYAQYGEYLADLREFIKSFGYKEELLAYKYEVHLYYHV